MALALFADKRRSPEFSQPEKVGEVCIANISPYERRKRMEFAIWQFIVAVVVLGVLITLNLDPLWRFPLLFLFSASTVGFFQARDKT
jgi:hypothetical protein